MKRIKKIKVPDEYTCPITYELMLDPVVTTSGMTYERKNIILNNINLNSINLNNTNLNNNFDKLGYKYYYHQLRFAPKMYCQLFLKILQVLLY